MDAGADDKPEYFYMVLSVGQWIFQLIITSELIKIIPQN
jgi:hypothetical protein